MNILIINASPKNKGNISQMLGVMADEAVAIGATVQQVSIAGLTVRPCTGCMRCRTTNQCALPVDDAQRVLEMIKWCDALVVGAPCYWGNIPGVLKVVFDRIVYGMMGESPRGLPRPLHKGKRAVVVTASTTPWPFNILFHQTSGVVRALKEILGYSGFKMAATVQKGGTKAPAGKGLTDRETRLCRKIMHKL